MADILLYQVDAFSDRPFAGNPAAVCPLTAWPPDELLQSIAAENNLSETAFFVEEEQGHRLRWFTPTSEVDLCGHATLAAAHVLFTELGHAQDILRFQTRSGPLTVGRGQVGYSMDFPARPPEPREAPQGLAEALGVTPREVVQARDLIAVVDDAELIRNLTPDTSAIAALDAFAVAITAPGTGRDEDVDFVSRFFAPREGIPEDPVTGSLHCTLAPYWSTRTGKGQLRARQVSARGGEIACALTEDRVVLAGQAYLVLRGVLVLPDPA